MLKSKKIFIQTVQNHSIFILYEIDFFKIHFWRLGFFFTQFFFAGFTPKIASTRQLQLRESQCTNRLNYWILWFSEWGIAILYENTFEIRLFTFWKEIFHFFWKSSWKKWKNSNIFVILTFFANGPEINNSINLKLIYCCFLVDICLKSQFQFSVAPKNGTNKFCS